MNKKGNFYIVAAPSGAGKTSLVQALAKALDDIEISVSYTTRPPRIGESQDVDYHFISEDKFQEMIKTKQFLEHAEVYGYHYGTSQERTLKQLDKGIDILLEIDWQGARQICQQFPQSVSIFILPPSITVLHERLKRRNQDNRTVIQQRMDQAHDEITHYHEFDYLLVNDVFDIALQDLIHIVQARRLRCSYQQSHLSSLLAELLKK